jgi:hypothetical protein
MVVNELKLVNLEQTDIETWNFEELKEELSKALSVYKTTVYTDDTIKMAKDDKAKLNKAKKIVEDRRKAYKEKCMKPYKALEPQIKEIVEMIEEQRTEIDGVVKDYTERQKAEKEETVRQYYNKKSFVLGELADTLYEKILDTKWLNASASKKKVQEEIQIAIQNASNDINTIKEMGSPFESSLLGEYVNTLSIDEVKKKNEELIDALSKVEISQSTLGNGSAVKTEVTPQHIANTEEGTVLRVFATKGQLTQVLDFMKAIGVDYEIQ